MYAVIAYLLNFLLQNQTRLVKPADASNKPNHFFFGLKINSLWSFSAAVALHTLMTPLEIIKDVIKPHQSRMQIYEQLQKKKTRAIPDTYGARTGGNGVISANTLEHWRPVSSRQVKGQINRVTVGMLLGRWTGLTGLLEQDTAASSADWKRGHNEPHQRGTKALPAWVHLQHT